MKRLICIFLLCSVLTLSFNSCGVIFDNTDNDDSKTDEPTEIISINRVNGGDYCEISPYFLGVEDNALVTSCWVEIDDNYKIYEEIYVEITVIFDLFYYTTLLGGDETHFTRYYTYSGFVSDDLAELTTETTYSETITKEIFQGKEPEIRMTRIFGKICR